MDKTELTASYLRKGTIQKIATDLSRKLDAYKTENLHKIVEELGGKIKYVKSSDLSEKNESIDIRPDGKFVIKLPSNTSTKRDRFTIAHELGHYLLHYVYKNKTGQKIEGEAFATRYGSDRAEWEANWFAAAFLMPKNEFKVALQQNRGNLDEVARQFYVSKVATEVRKKEV